jgi:hypothetical protein
LAAIGWHFLLLAINLLACKAARLPESERKAVVIMASQKNLPTAAVIISYFDPSSVGNLGLMTVPCVVWYVAQLFVDAYLATGWASKFERLLKLEEVYREELKALGVGGDTAGGGGGVGEKGGGDKANGEVGLVAASAPLLGVERPGGGDSAGEGAAAAGKKASSATTTSTSVLASAALLRRRSSATAGGERPQQQQQPVDDGSVL